METTFFGVNPILNATDGSFPKSIRVSTVHDSTMEAKISIPFIGIMYGIYHPIHLELIAKNNAFIAQGGMQEGETLTVVQFLKLLRGTKARQWDTAIQQVYDITTPRYKQLMPNRRTPFQVGTQQGKIEEVKALSLRIGTDTELVDVKADADLFYSQAHDAYAHQQGSIHLTPIVSQQCEQARVAMCQAQFGNLGTFIHEYRATPEMIPLYFDVKNISSHHQVLFSKELEPLAKHCICKHTSGRDDEFEITNLGITRLQFWRVQLKGNPMPELVLTVEPGTKVRVKASELGDVSFSFIMVYNSSSLSVGSYEFEIL